MPATNQSLQENSGGGVALRDDPWRVLVVDDRPERRKIMKIVLGTVPPDGREEVAVAEAATVTTAVAALRLRSFDAAIVEIQMPTDEGAGVIEELRAAQPSLVIVVCSFRVDQATRLRAIQAGADAFLSKPVSRRDLLRACGSYRGI
jgi:DNA-binding NarL/FixJ family response regulator